MKNKLHLKTLFTLAGTVAALSACGPAEPADDVPAALRSPAPNLRKSVRIGPAGASVYSRSAPRAVDLQNAADWAAAVATAFADAYPVRSIKESLSCAEATVMKEELRATVVLSDCQARGESYSGTLTADIDSEEGASQLAAAVDLHSESSTVTGTLLVNAASSSEEKSMGFDASLFYESDAGFRQLAFSGSLRATRQGQMIDGQGSYEDGNWSGTFVVSGLFHSPAACYPGAGDISVEASGTVVVEVTLPSGQMTEVETPATATGRAAFDSDTQTSGAYELCVTIDLGTLGRQSSCTTRQMPWTCG